MATSSPVLFHSLYSILSFRSVVNTEPLSKLATNQLNMVICLSMMHSEASDIQ